jgi:hypothetical protein
MLLTSQIGAISEVKFLVSPALALRLREFARTYFAPDGYGTGPFADEYDTATLYFDTDELDVFHRCGSYGRAKYRVRRYGDADTIFLERKLRQPGRLIKRRTGASMGALGVLSEERPRGGWDGAWFHRRLLLRGLHPVCQISYHRLARVLDAPDGWARLTLDDALRVTRRHEARFSSGFETSFLGSDLILELKYGPRLPSVCRRLVEEFALCPRSASKYRLGMAGLCQGALHAYAPPAENGVFLHA